MKRTQIVEIVSFLTFVFLSFAKADAGRFDLNDPNRVAVVGVEIFGNKAAAALTMSARSVDPLWGSESDRSGDRAILLYENAIALQPNEPINGALAVAIARIYSLGDQNRVPVNPKLAKEWWNRAAGYLNPKEELWAETQLGLAHVCLAGNDGFAAVEACRRVLAVNPSQVEPAPWIAFGNPFLSPTPGALSDKALAQITARKEFERIREQAVELLKCASQSISQEFSQILLQEISIKYLGTTVGDLASRAQGTLTPQSLGIDIDERPTTRPLGQQ